MTSHPAELHLNKGAREALNRNPEFEDLILALCAAPSPAPDISVEREVRRAAARELSREKLLRWARPAATAAAAAAVVMAALILAPSSDSGAKDAAPRTLAVSSIPEATQTVETFAETGAGDFSHFENILASQRADGSWLPEKGGDAYAPAATAQAILRLCASGDARVSPALQRGVAWLRKHQNTDGSFGVSVPDSSNTALPALALLRLYQTGDWPELFTPIDSAIARVRADARTEGGRVRDSDLWVASALATADTLEWPDELSGDLRRAMRRLESSGEPRVEAIAKETTFSRKRDALLQLASI